MPKELDSDGFDIELLGTCDEIITAIAEQMGWSFDEGLEKTSLAENIIETKDLIISNHTNRFIKSSDRVFLFEDLAKS